MNLGLTKGSKVRTILRIATSLNNALCVTTVAINELNINLLVTVWIVLTILTDFIVSYITTYYNNDYTEIACKNTGKMRAEKQQSKEDYVGECFTDEAEEVGDC